MFYENIADTKELPLWWFQALYNIAGAVVAEWLSSWLAEQEDRGSIPGLATWIFRDWLFPAPKSRYGWKITKSTLILKTTNQYYKAQNDWMSFNGRTDLFRSLETGLRAN